MRSISTYPIASGKSLIQVVEDKNVNGTSYVLSWTGTAQARYSVNSATPAGSYAASPIVITGQTAGSTMSVEFNTGTLSKPQLELGSVATSFDQRAYGTELALCQRYYWKGTSITWTNTTTSNYNGTYISWKVSMRAAPTVTSYSTVTGTSGKIRYQDGSSDVNAYIPSPTVDGSSLSVNNVSTAVGSNMSATVTAEIEL